MLHLSTKRVLYKRVKVKPISKLQVMRQDARKKINWRTVTFSDKNDYIQCMKFKFAFFLLICALSINSQTKVLLDEEFEDNKNNWDVGGAKDEFSEISYGKYIIENYSKNSWHWFAKSVPIEKKKDFVISSNINRLKTYNETDAIGLMWGTANPQNCFIFMVNAEARAFAVKSLNDGNWFSLINWTKSSKINYGNAANKLSVIKVGREFGFVINDEIVARAPYQEPYGDKIGFYIGPQTKISVDDIFVKEVDQEKENTSEKVASDWAGNGSGFIIDSRGYIATNYHVVENSNAIQIDVVNNGVKKTYKAKVVSSDKQNDLSILKIDDPDFKPFNKLPFNFKSQITDVGSNVFSLGYPMALTIMGDEIKFSDGKVSSKTGYQGDITTYQVSVPVQPGNSGGPLFDYDGNLIGVVNAKIMSADNVSYAIKSSYLKSLIEILPETLDQTSDNSLSNKTLTEKIKILSNYVVLIKIK